MQLQIKKEENIITWVLRHVPLNTGYKTDKEGEEYLSERGWEATYQVEKTTSNEYYRKQGRNG